MVDLVIQTAGGSQVAVEVTTLTPEDSARFQNTCSRLAGPNDALGRTWSVRFLRSADIKLSNIKKARASLITLLRELEAAGVERVDINDRTGEQQLLDRVRALGLIKVSSVMGPGWILTVNHMIGATDASGEILTTVAADVLNDPKRKDNARKLRATGFDHRHLFLCVSWLAGPIHIAVEQALRSEFLPSAAPSASEDYTGVWIAIDESQPVARWTRESGWKLLAPSTG